MNVLLTDMGRPFQREGLAHYRRQVCRRDGLRPRLHDYERRSPVLCNVRLRNGRLRLQQRNTRLGVDDLRADKGEEGHLARGCQHVCGHWKHLFPRKFTGYCPHNTVLQILTISFSTSGRPGVRRAIPSPC